MTRTARGSIGAVGLTIALSGLIAFVGNPFGGGPFGSTASSGGGSGSATTSAPTFTSTQTDGGASFVAPTSGRVYLDGPTNSVYLTYDGGNIGLVGAELDVPSGFTDSQKVNADSDISPHAVISQAASGEYAFRALHDGVYWDIGASTNDRIYASNGTVIANSWKFGDITVETIGAAQGYIWMFSPTPFPVGSLTACSSGRKGALQTLSSDGRLYQCNGTADQTLGYRTAWTGALDFAVFASNSCQTLTFTATGAVAGEPVAEGGCGLVMAGDADVTCKVSISATNTASVRICCNDTLGCADLGSITFTAAALR